MTTTVTTRNLDCPVTLDEAKAHLRVFGDDQDTYIQSLIEAATEYCEGATGRAFRTSETIVQTYDGWPSCGIQFDRQPVLAISSLKYYDDDNVLQTVNSSNYRLMSSRNAAAVLEIDSAYSWPSYYGRSDAIQLTYTAGYSVLTDTPADSDGDPPPVLGVPATAKHAIKLIVGHWFNHSEAVNIGNITSEVPMAANALLAMLDPGTYR